jgi:hypothetical protein
MRWNHDATQLVNDLADFGRGRAFQIWKCDAEAEQVALGGRHLDAGDDEETIDGLAIGAHEPVIAHVMATVARVVIRECKAVQALPARGRDE